MASKVDAVHKFILIPSMSKDARRSCNDIPITALDAAWR